MGEQTKYEVIKALVDDPSRNKQRAALNLGCTIRHINRMIAGYKKHGKAYFVHGNRGRKPVTTVAEDVRALVVELYKSKYIDANFTHYTELLESIEGISLSVSTVASILEDHCILSPKATRAKKKRIKAKLHADLSAAKSKKDIKEIKANLVAIENAHSRRPRCSYFGELIQMDGSPHRWFNGEVTTLHVAVDDATGRIVGAYFDKEESLNGYYHVFSQILKEYGIPAKFFTDRRTVFTYKKKNSPSVDEDTYTQFAYACKQFGVVLESSSVPQAKGRVERLNGTLQSRLPIELRLRGISTMDEANEFLNSYIKEFNAKLALPLNGIRSVFETQPSDEKINLTLAILSERTIDSAHSIQFRKKYYRLLDGNGEQIHFRKATKVMVIQAFNGVLYCSVNDNDVYVLEEIPMRQALSKEFDATYEEPKKRKRYIPPMNHPWRRATFSRFVMSQPHNRDVDLLSMCP